MRFDFPYTKLGMNLLPLPWLNPWKTGVRRDEKLRTEQIHASSPVKAAGVAAHPGALPALSLHWESVEQEQRLQRFGKSGNQLVLLPSGACSGENQPSRKTRGAAWREKLIWASHHSTGTYKEEEMR